MAVTVANDRGYVKAASAARGGAGLNAVPPLPGA